MYLVKFIIFIASFINELYYLILQYAKYKNACGLHAILEYNDLFVLLNLYGNLL